MTQNELETITQTFTHELQKATRGEKTSLPFLLSPLPPLQNHIREPFQSIVIGGSLTQSALVQNKQLQNVFKQKQPLFTSAKDFFIYMATIIDPSVSFLCLNFAYPIKPLLRDNRLDGILVTGSKENHFSELLNKTVGEQVERYIKENLQRTIQVTVANDTICLLLAGLSNYSGNELVGGVIGTGINFAFFKDNNTMVNTESGNFSSFIQSETGKKIDINSTHPGKALFEKEVSGAYLYRHFNILLQQKRLAHSQLNSTKELGLLAEEQGGAATDLARNLLLNSAQLVATQIAGITRFKKRDLVFVIEGSLFCDNLFYQKEVIKTVTFLTKPFTCQFVRLPESSLLGAAELGYTSSQSLINN